jgi:hypothetical protein
MSTETFTITLPNGADQDNLFEHIRLAMPSAFRPERTFEDIHALAALYTLVMAQARDWTDMMLIGNAIDIWLEAHAKDRGTGRQAGESDEELRARIRTLVDVVTRPALLQAAQDIVDAAGIVGDVAMVELRRDRAFYGDLVADSGTGGTFLEERGLASFQPTAGYASPPYRDIEEEVEHRLVISGAASAANDGTFTISGLAGDAALYTNGAVVAELDAGVSWSVERRDRDGNTITGFRRSYFGRGYRYGNGVRPFVIILILPFGCTSATVASVEEMLRQRQAGGIRSIVECRQVP